MSEATLTGSCLCGAVRYEVMGEPARFYHCHCSRCRKATGTGHASNLLVPGDGLRFLSGEDLLAAYKLPESERFTNRFCSRCGGRVPRLVPELGAVIVPAGSLDGEPPIGPQARIFWDSRASWSCGGEELPTYPDTPPAN